MSEAPEGPRIRTCLARPGAKECIHIPPEQISEALHEPDALLWVDINQPQQGDLEMLREEFQFHQLALEDVASQRQRPKVDEYPGYTFVVMYAPLPCQPGEEVQTAEVDVFVGANYVVTLHDGHVPAMKEAFDRWQRTQPDVRGNVGFLFHTVLDALVDAYFPVVDELEDRLDQLEIRLFQNSRVVRAAEMLAIKRSLFTLRKAAYPMREVFNAFLRRDHPLFSPETLPYFQDVYDHVLRLLDIIDIQRDMATGTLDAHLAVISNRLNETMKTLTVVTLFVAIAGCVFGAWGMNVEHIPLSHSREGFWWVCGGTVVVEGVMLAWAKHRKLW